MRELTRDFHPVLSPLYVAEDPRSGEGLQACFDRGCPRLQLASSSCEAVWAEVGLMWSTTRSALRPCFNYRPEGPIEGVDGAKFTVCPS